MASRWSEVKLRLMLLVGLEHDGWCGEGPSSTASLYNAYEVKGKFYKIPMSPAMLNVIEC